MNNREIIFYLIDILKPYMSSKFAAEHIATIFLLRNLVDAPHIFSSYGINIPDSASQMQSLSNNNAAFAIKDCIRDFEVKNGHLMDNISILFFAEMPDDLHYRIWHELGRSPTINLTNGLLSSGEFVEELLRYGNSSDIDGRALFTPETVLDLMLGFAKPSEGQSIHDPTCGGGGCLIAAAKYVSREGGNPQSLYLSGQDINLRAVAVSKIGLLAYGLTNFNIEIGDTLNFPRFTITPTQLERFDHVITTPPISVRLSSQPVDQFGRWGTAVSAKTRADLYFLLHALSATNTNGNTILLMPLSFLFREDIEGDHRINFLERGYIKAVVSLPTDVLPYSNVATAIVLFSKIYIDSTKPIFISKCDSINLGWKLKEREISLKNAKVIVDAYKKHMNIDSLARWVELDEIIEHKYQLSPNIYLSNADEKITISDAKEQMTVAESEYDLALRNWLLAIEKLL